MNNIEHNDNVAQDQQSINITPEQLETLFQQFAARLKTEEKGRGERTILPYQIMAEMDETPSPEMRTTIKKYAREVPLYEGGNWTASETTNKIFIPDLKRHKVDAHQVVSQRYKDADHLRIAARAATEVFEDLSYVQENGGDNAVLMDIIEKTRRLAIYSYITAKSIDKEARDLSATALRLPSNMRYIEEEEESNKKLAFSTESVEKIQQARYEQQILRSAIQHRQDGFRGRGGIRSGFSNYQRGNQFRSKIFFGRGRGRTNQQPGTNSSQIPSNQ
ncbi:hypothetical protein G6F52_012773 [Rhizopus delemar]|nr:hypothetical protein G6F52_012773 [Rhizopus delemar]